MDNRNFFPKANKKVQIPFVRSDKDTLVIYERKETRI